MPRQKGKVKMFRLALWRNKAISRRYSTEQERKPDAGVSARTVELIVLGLSFVGLSYQINQSSTKLDVALERQNTTNEKLEKSIARLDTAVEKLTVLIDKGEDQRIRILANLRYHEAKLKTLEDHLKIQENNDKLYELAFHVEDRSLDDKEHKRWYDLARLRAGIPDPKPSSDKQAPQKK